MKFLTDISSDRDEIAEALCVSRRTVDSWFAEGASRRNVPPGTRLLAKKLVDGKFLNTNLTAFVDGFDLEAQNRADAPLMTDTMTVTYRLDLDGSVGKIRICFQEGDLVRSEVVLKHGSHRIEDVYFRSENTLVLLTSGGWIELGKFPKRLKAFLSN